MLKLMIIIFIHQTLSVDNNIKTDLPNYTDTMNDSNFEIIDIHPSDKSTNYDINLPIIQRKDIAGSSLFKSKEKQKKVDVTTEIILEYTDAKMMHDNASTTQPNYVNTTENVTNIDILEEDITEMLNISTTTIIPTSTEKSKSKKSKSKKHASKNIKKTKYCHCDLSKGTCDVNCCCDTECSDSDKSIFTDCLREVIRKQDMNLKYCHTREIIYKNNTPWLRDEQNNGLFCIMNDNLPPKLPSNTYEVITSAAKIESVARQYFTWPYEKKSDVDVSAPLKPYRHADDIWIIVNSSLRIFEIPSRKINMFCNSKKNIKYLIDAETNCISRFPKLKTYEVLKNYNNTFLISSLNAMNETWISNVKECPLNVCIPFEPFLCNSSDCISLINTTKDFLNITCNKMSCSDVVTSIKYHLFSNGTMGFTKAHVYFGTTDIPNDSKYVEEKYEIKHIWVPKNSTTHVRALSGNPGYVIEKPIICAKIITKEDNNTSETIQMFDYFLNESDYPTRNLMIYPENINGYCVLSNVTFDTILFGENVHSQCEVKLFLDNNNNTDIMQNATVLCEVLQQQVNYYLPDDLYLKYKTKLYVSMFGDPSYKTSDWIEFIDEKSEYAIEGSFDNNKTLFCNNFRRKVHYEFIYTHVDHLKDGRTVKLLGNGVKYTRHRERFEIDSEKIGILISTTVRFYDITTDQNIKYAKGPQFHINLPSDFFYPFTYNGQTKNNHENSNYFFILCIVLNLAILQ